MGRVIDGRICIVSVGDIETAWAGAIEAAEAGLIEEEEMGCAVDGVKSAGVERGAAVIIEGFFGLFGLGGFICRFQGFHRGTEGLGGCLEGLEEVDDMGIDVAGIDRAGVGGLVL